MSTNDYEDSLKKYDTNDYIAYPCVNPNFLTEEECKRVITLGESLPDVDASVGSGETASVMHLYTRSSVVKWVGYDEENAWLFEKIRDAINIANSTYKFELDHELSTLQLAKYSVGGHYIWHSDVGQGLNSFRKLSLTVQLSDPEDYNGGDLEFMIKSNQLPEKQRKQGAAVIFPSFLEHQVTVVTKGSRWSIVAWVSGPPFR